MTATDELLDTNPRVPAFLVERALPHLEASGNAAVLNIISAAAFLFNPHGAMYSAGKAALVGVTRTLAKEWGRYRVNVNCVAFGLIDTRLTQTWEGDEIARIEVGGRRHPVGFDDATRQQIAERIPLGRPGTPEEAAGAVYLLCTPESDYISGEVLVAGGGLLSL